MYCPKCFKIIDTPFCPYCGTQGVDSLLELPNDDNSENTDDVYSLYRQKALDGDEVSIRALAEVQGDPRDVAALLKAAENGHALAQYEIAYAYYYGSPILAKDHKMAYSWMKKAAEQGDFYAQIGMCDFRMEMFPSHVDTVPEIKKWLKAAEESQKGPDELRTLKRKKFQFFLFKWFGK